MLRCGGSAVTVAFRCEWHAALPYLSILGLHPISARLTDYWLSQYSQFKHPCSSNAKYHNSVFIIGCHSSVAIAGWATIRILSCIPSDPPIV